ACPTATNVSLSIWNSTSGALSSLVKFLISDTAVSCLVSRSPGRGNASHAAEGAAAPYHPVEAVPERVLSLLALHLEGDHLLGEASRGEHHPAGAPRGDVPLPRAVEAGALLEP